MQSRIMNEWKTAGKFDLSYKYLCARDKGELFIDVYKRISFLLMSRKIFAHSNDLEIIHISYNILYKTQRNHRRVIVSVRMKNRK